MRLWIRALIILAVVWGMVAAAVLFTRSVKPSAESITEFIESNPIAERTPEERSRIISRAAQMLNRLEFKERQRFRELQVDRTFFEQMTKEERLVFLEATLPEGFRQLMEALNKMEPKERQRIVKRALADIERETPDLAGRLDDEDTQKLISEGLESFYEEANAEVKLEFAPVIERLQRATQGIR